MITDHTPWARSIFAEQRLWLACYCGWNAMGDAEGTWNDHADSLDAAWAEAEAALPEGWILGLIARSGQYLAEAWEDDEAYASGDSAADAFAATPAAALRALAERLRERAG